MKGTFRRLLLLGLAHSALGCFSHAGIAFEKATLSTEAGAGEETLHFAFKFKVTGDRPLTITEIRPNCGCLSVKEIEMKYKGGGAGEIDATMMIGEMEGEVAKTIDVFTNDPAQRVTTLTCITKIPRTYDISPQVCTWDTGDAATPKKMSFKILDKNPVKVLSAKSANPNFSAEVKEIKAGREYEIILTPKSTDRPALCLVDITTDHPDKRLQVRKVFANIVRKRS